MTREEKILLAIEKGITCDPITGKVYGIRGKQILSNDNGYIRFTIKNIGSIKCHQFVYYWVHKTIVDCIDHINNDKSDNRISNLRSITHQKNCFNTNAKGYSWNKPSKKWLAEISIDGKRIHLGRFETEQEARQAYLNAKEIYHII